MEICRSRSNPCRAPKRKKYIFFVCICIFCFFIRKR